jgi:hypothetical protein
MNIPDVPGRLHVKVLKFHLFHRVTGAGEVDAQMSAGAEHQATREQGIYQAWLFEKEVSH